MSTTKNLATVPSIELSNAINLIAEANGEIVRLPYSLIDEKLVPLEEHMDNENNPHKLDTDDIGAATAQEVQDLKTEFSEYKISNDAELAQQKSDLDNHTHTAEEVGARPNTWIPTTSEIWAMAWTPNSAIYDATTVLEVVNAMYTGGSFAAVQGRPLCTASDSPMSGVEFHYLVLQDEHGRKRVVAISFGDNQFIIYTRRTFSNAWLDDKWKRMDDVFLPKTGGTLSNGICVTQFVDLLVNGIKRGDVANWGSGETIVSALTNDSVTRRYLSICDQTMKSMYDALSFVETDGTNYNVAMVYGTHNITCGNTEPTSLANGCIYEMYE